MPDTDYSRITATIIGDSSLRSGDKQVSKLVNVLEVTEFQRAKLSEEFDVKSSLSLVKELKRSKDIFLKSSMLPQNLEY